MTTSTWQSMTFPKESWSWDPPAARRYSLAIGAPKSSLEPRDLALVMGADPTPFPTIAVLLADAHSFRYHALPGLEYDPLDIIYAGHELEITGPLPSKASGHTETTILRAGDNSAGVIVERESVSTDTSGAVIAVNRVTSIIRGATIGSPPGAPRSANASSTADAGWDTSVTVHTLPQQALLYAQTGDDNPLHLDPAAARRAGFDRPILHGLCTYAMVAHALMADLFDGRWSDLRRIASRFSSPVVPGETLEVRVCHREGGVDFEVWVPEPGPGRQVLARGELDVAPAEHTTGVHS